jgi:hypothetical protein
MRPPQAQLKLLAALNPGLSQQQHRLPFIPAPPPGVSGGAGVGWSGEKGRSLGGGMRASDIGGVGGPAATPAPGPSPQRHWPPLLPVAPAPGVRSEKTIAGHTSSSGDRTRNVPCSSLAAVGGNVRGSAGNVQIPRGERRTRVWTC